MKKDYEKALKSPTDADTGSASHRSQSPHHALLQHKVDDIVNAAPKEIRPALKQFGYMVTDELEDMRKDQENEKKLTNKEHEILRHAIVNEITQILDKKLGIQNRDIRTTISETRSSLKSEISETNNSLRADIAEIKQSVKTAMYFMAATIVACTSLAVSIMSYIK